MLPTQKAQFIDPQVVVHIREQRGKLQEGDIVSAKYIGGSSTVVITGRLGKPKSAPYIFQPDGSTFQILPSVTFTSGLPYAFASLDKATPYQEQEFRKEAQEVAWK